MSTLMFFNRPGITGPYSSSLVKQSSLLTATGDEVMMLTYGISESYHGKLFRNMHMTPRLVSYRTQLFRDITLADDRYADTFTPVKTWEAAVDKGFQEVFGEVLGDIDRIVVFGGIVSPFVNRKNNKLNSLYRTNTLFTMQNFCRSMLGTYYVIRLANTLSLPIHEVCYDPGENSVSQLDIVENDVITYHSYDSQHYGFSRLDAYQYYLMKYEHSEPVEKDVRVVFGGTVTTKSRVGPWTRLQPLVETFGQNDRLHMKITKPVIIPRTDVPHNEYVKTLARSKFTVIIPAYDDAAFSGLRFIEAIFNRCLPLITEDCPYDEFVRSFGIEQSVVNRLVHPHNELAHTVEAMGDSERMELVDYLYDKVIRFERRLHE